jgi:mannose-6-phosphate isomerase-like protein (cupin superfamily)
MILRDIESCNRFRAMDETLLCELLHPAQEKLGIHYSIAHAILKPGTRSLNHRLKDSSEVYYILEGEGIIYIDNESALVKPGQALYIPRGSWQNILNIGIKDLKFLCVVHPSWREEDEELSP